MLPSRLQTKPTFMRRWTVRVCALLTIIGTLLLLLAEQPNSSIRDLLQYRLPSSFGSSDLNLIRPHVSSVRTELSSDKPCTPGYIFYIPDGRSPTIYDQTGNLIWQEKRNALTQNLRVQTFRGQDYLTYWTKEPFGPGRYYMLDSSYTERYIVVPVGTIIDSLHDFTVTRRDTALIAAHYKRRADLSALGGPVEGWILDGIFQEIDIITGNLLYEWRAVEHMSIADTFKILDDGEGTENHPFDYFHISGVDQSPSGDYLVSSGHMRSVMSIDASTGEVQWSLGGRANDFRDFGDRPVVDFEWPHNVRVWAENGTVTVMDKGGPVTRCRGMAVHIDPHTSLAVLQETYNGPTELYKLSDGDMQISQSTGNALISWGRGRGLSEFTSDGELLCDHRIINPLSVFGFSKIAAPSRASKHTWTGKPLTKPMIKISGHKLHVHWNGATEVAGWQLDLKEQRSSSEANASPYLEIGRYRKTGFETLLIAPPLKGKSRYFLRVAALDQQGQILGYTDDVEWQQAWTGSELSQSQFRVLAGTTINVKMSSIIANLGLTATNYTSAFLLWNYTYAYMLTSTRSLKFRAGIDHNANPRYDLAKYGERAVAEGKITRKKLGQLQRGASAHANSIESFTLFATTIVLMNVAKLNAETINMVGLTYSILRIGYVQAYFYFEDYRLSFIRSILWHFSNFSCFYGIWFAGKALQA